MDLLHEKLRADRRPPDGLLHCSSDLIGSLRHSMLSAAGAPRVDSQLVSDIRLMTGTFWHRYIEAMLKEHGMTLFTELDVTPGLPEGWSGTADWVFWLPDKEAWVLGDLKTIKGEGLRWVQKDGIKTEHLWQLSAYFWALVDMGYPMLDGFAVLYLPMNDTPDKSDVVEPTLQEASPLPREVVQGQMGARWELTSNYLQTVPAGAQEPSQWLTDALAAEQDREQKYYWNSQQGVFDVKLVPHWSTSYCPYPDVLCACNQQGTTKVGHWSLEGEYVPRRGYEEIEPLVKPTAREFAQKLEVR